MPRKSLILAFLLGWALAVFLSPRDVVGWFRGKAGA